MNDENFLDIENNENPRPESIINSPSGIQLETKRISVNIKLPETITKVGYVLNPTGETNYTSVINGKIRLMQNRTYYIPIDTDVDSDEYFIKVPSEIAEKIDVRFVKDGYACVIPLQHNISLRNGQRICFLYIND